MNVKERIDSLRKEVTDSFDRYNRNNDFDDPVWREQILNGLAILKDDLLQNERKRSDQRAVVRGIISAYVKNIDPSTFQTLWKLYTQTFGPIDQDDLRRNCINRTLTDEQASVIAMFIESIQ
jgi:hypothetical protein